MVRNASRTVRTELKICLKSLLDDQKIYQLLWQKLQSELSERKTLGKVTCSQDGCNTQHQTKIFKRFQGLGRSTGVRRDGGSKSQKPFPKLPLPSRGENLPGWGRRKKALGLVKKRERSWCRGKSFPESEPILSQSSPANSAPTVVLSPRHAPPPLPRLHRRQNRGLCVCAASGREVGRKKQILNDKGMEKGREKKGEIISLFTSWT